MTSELTSRFRYDIPTAVTFLIFGLGAGWLLAMLRPPRLHHKAVVPITNSQRAS